LPPRAEPGDHDALVLVTTRPRSDTGVAVRMRMGIVVIVRAPGKVVRRLAAGRLRSIRQGRIQLLEVVVASYGNVTETLRRGSATLTLLRGGRRLARLAAGERNLRPSSRGILQFRYVGGERGVMSARIEIKGEPGRDVVRRTYRIRL
jgi:hypothetical protein